MTRARWAAVAFAVYVAAIVLSNWLIVHVGIPAGPGTHLTPVGFGLLAPSGVWAAAVSFPARDVVQRLTPGWQVRLPLIGNRKVPVVSILAILVGAGVSWWVSAPVIARASGGTYLISETVDMGFYSWLQRRWFLAGVLVSSLIASAVDSWVFLHWAGIYTPHLFCGQVVGKWWVQIPAFAVIWALRKTRPMRQAATPEPEAVTA